MKTLILLSGLFLMGCAWEPSKKHPITAELEGNHPLRKMFTTAKLKTTGGRVDGFFLLGFGGLSGESSTTERIVTVTFAARNFRGEYVIFTLPIEKVRVAFDESVKVPYVKFRWTKYVHPVTDLQRAIIYAVVVCREKDWPQDINLPNLSF